MSGYIIVSFKQNMLKVKCFSMSYQWLLKDGVSE